MENITFDSIGLLIQRDAKTLMIGMDGPKYDSEKKFIQDFSKLFGKKKFVIVNVFAFEPTEYESNLDFCKAIKEKLDDLQIPHYFITPDIVFASTALIAGNITVQFQDIVLFVVIEGDGIHVRELEYTENGYKKLSGKGIKVNQNESHQAIREKILGSTNFKKILLLVHETDNANRKLFKSVLKSKKLIILERGMDYKKFAVELAKWYFDKSYTKFHFLPTASRCFNLSITLNQTFHELITLQIHDPLPFKKTVSVPMFFKNNIIWSLDEINNRDSIVQCISSFHHEGHEYKIDLTVDDESFPKITVHAGIKNSIQSLPEIIDKQMTKKLPVIGFYHYSSIICVCKEDGYKFLDSWNGLFGKNLIIGFDKEKPSFCEDAAKLLLTTSTFAVYDLINIMSMPADKIVPNKLWTFTVTEDAEHPVLLEFDSFDGTKKAASPAFLMAMLLRKHFKAIKKETGEKPTEIGFRLFQDFNQEENARVEEQLKEACDLLKINCTFV